MVKIDKWAGIQEDFIFDLGVVPMFRFRNKPNYSGDTYISDQFFTCGHNIKKYYIFAIWRPFNNHTRHNLLSRYHFTNQSFRKENFITEEIYAINKNNRFFIYGPQCEKVHFWLFLGPCGLQSLDLVSLAFQLSSHLLYQYTCFSYCEND